MTHAGCAACARHQVEPLPSDFRERTRHVHDALKAAQAPRPRVAVIDGMDPLTIAGHWVPEQVKRAGGIAVLGMAGAHSQAITVDALRAADPEVLVFAPCGDTGDAAARAARQLLALPEWSWMQGRRVVAIDGNVLASRTEAGLVTGIETLAALLNPACFPAESSKHAAMVVLPSIPLA